MFLAISSQLDISIYLLILLLFIFFLHLCTSILTFSFFVWRTHFSVSFESNLLVMNSLNFYLLENVFISSSILKSVSAECSIQHSDIIALNFGLLCFVEILCHFNYFSFEEKLFSVLRFSLCWVYDLYGVIFFSTSSLGVWRDSYICYLISLINLKKFSAIISFNIVSASFLSPLSWDSNYIC